MLRIFYLMAALLLSSFWLIGSSHESRRLFVALDRARDGVASDASPTARPVSIGEGGTRFAACQGRGRVGGLRGGELPVRDAALDAMGTAFPLAGAGQATPAVTHGELARA